jgi:hypothetical protein
LFFEKKKRKREKREEKESKKEKGEMTLFPNIIQQFKTPGKFMGRKKSGG